MLVASEPVQDFEALVTDSRFVFAVGMVYQDIRIRDVPYSLNHKLTRLSFYSLPWGQVSPLYVSHSITEDAVIILQSIMGTGVPFVCLTFDQ
jgi:hypothetical protein